MEIVIDTSNKEPMILVDDELVTFSDGIQAILKYKKWDRDDMAHFTKVSRRTVDGWCNGRKPSNPVIMTLSLILKF